MRPQDMRETTRTQKKSWIQPSLKYLGHVGDILQGGGGKLSPMEADSGDIRKPKGQG